MTDHDKIDEKGQFDLKVNGVQISVENRYLTALAILQLAKEKGAMPGAPDDYMLQGDKGQYAQDALVDLAEDNVFITIPTAPTPVA